MSLPFSEPLRFGDTIALAAVDAEGYLCCNQGLSRCFVDHVSHFDSNAVVRPPPIVRITRFQGSGFHEALVQTHDP